MTARHASDMITEQRRTNELLAQLANNGVTVPVTAVTVTPVTRQVSDEMQKAIDWLEANESTTKSLRQIADIVGVSYGTIKRAKERIGL